jgi:RNA polymerase sigma factor (TIGR02999 family)
VTRSESDEARPVDPVAARLYDELRELARLTLDRAGEAGSVDATDLVHECYLKLARVEEFRMLGKGPFLALAASILRRVLVDLARRRAAEKRGGGWARTTLSGASDQVFGGAGEVDLLDLDAALGRLEALDTRQHRIVELRFFAGLSVNEIAGDLGVSRRTIHKEWTLARAWLKRELER